MNLPDQADNRGRRCDCQPIYGENVMPDISDKIEILIRGELHTGTIKAIKFGLAYIDFKNQSYKNGWFEIRRIRKI
jgi:hypothetical protein